MRIVLVMEAVQQRMGSAPRQRAAVLLVVQSRAARHAAQADRTQEHVLAAPLRTRRAVLYTGLTYAGLISVGRDASAAAVSVITRHEIPAAMRTATS